MEELLVKGGTPQAATLKRINMRRFLEELRRRGPSTRADLTRAIGVTPPTSSSVIAELLEAGFLEETEVTSAPRGRPGKLFRLATSRAFVIGATIDIRDCVLHVAGLDGSSNGKPEKFATPTSYKELVRAIANHVESVTRASAGRCLGIGLAVPGLVDERKGMVAFSPNLHFLDGQRICRDLQEELGIPVVATQEEHALCLSEQNVGKASKLNHFAVMDFSSGVGMGVVSGGRYVSGAQGFAGEIGHIQVVPNGILCGCGNRGCLETVASDTALIRSVSNRLGREIAFPEVASLCIQEELDQALSYVALGIATVINLFNPSAIFVHGGLFLLRQDVCDIVAEKAKARALAPSSAGIRIEVAEGTKLHGATTGLLDHLFESVGPRLV
jgi:N-acetylglucosamine repressor